MSIVSLTLNFILVVQGGKDAFFIAIVVGGIIVTGNL